MDRKTAEGQRGIREVLESIPEEHFQSIWSCFYRPVLLHFTPAALAAAKKSAINRLSGQESLFEDEDRQDEDVVHLAVLHNILRCDRTGELAALIKERQDWASTIKLPREEPPDEWNCSACRRPFPKGIDWKPCPCGSHLFTGTPPQPLAPYQIRV